ncbi:hypothetical protein [Magnetospirillum sulfuroxidans]|uniref:Transposase n=1 Tax=Magnetospirillum sulfuroxidans TaxID=611300 RepID=A0ABS5I903_9PROT|nr:hypothetical protein [Magnetospirillum sulfuroxidans]MBR9970173.1 hypothetical protein [Magnetospirillum sulfuroxidans]
MDGVDFCPETFRRAISGAVGRQIGQLNLVLKRWDTGIMCAMAAHLAVWPAADQ